MDENGIGVSKKEHHLMGPLNEASRIDANVAAVENYLQKEFDNFSIAHRTDEALRHIFTVHDGKKLFTLSVEWQFLADSSIGQLAMDDLSHENVAGEMRLRGEGGYHWHPLYKGVDQQGNM